MDTRAALLLFLGVLGLAASPAQAQPANDSRLTPTVIAALPFSDTVVDVNTATTAPDDPEAFCAGGLVTPGAHTVWYRYTASTEATAADRYVTVFADGNGDSIVQVFEDRGGTLAGIPGACNDDALDSGSSGRIDGLPLARGQAYLIEVTYFTQEPAGTTLQLSMQPTPVYVVTKTADTQDGQCDADCSLREAVIRAAITGGAIELPAGEYPLTIPGAGERDGATGDLNIGISRRGVSINGMPAGGDRPVIRQTTQDRVIENESRSTLILRDLVITGGSATSASDRFGGGISQVLAYLGAERVDIVDNVAAADGGGIDASITQLWLRDSRVAGNSAAASGGGVNFIRSTGGQVRLERTAFVGNTAAQGAAINIEVACSGCPAAPVIAAMLENVTVSGNVAANGAAVALVPFRNSRATLRHLTVADNTASGLAIQTATGSTVTLERSAFGRNAATAGPADCTTDTAAAMTVRLNTAEVPGNCPWPPADNDVVAEVGLDALTVANGQDFHLPMATGPLVDRDVAAGCAATDQRGVARPVILDDAAAPCDRGAIELDGPVDRVFANGFE